MKCQGCGENPTIKSNQAIAEEVERISEYLKPPADPSCPHEDCENHGKSIGRFPRRYARAGKTHSGSQRYSCKSCRRTFAVGQATRYQKMPHKNKQVFKLLVNKMPFNRILEVADISVSTLYGKMDFLYEQCARFAANRERNLLAGKRFKELHISVDRQEYVVNWLRREDKRNISLLAVGSADQSSGYIFGMHLNFDPSLQPDEIEELAVSLGDYDVPLPHRRFARLWLKQDYEESLKGANRKKPKKQTAGSGLVGEAASVYAEAEAREDVEISQEQTPYAALPHRGMQVHAEYTLYAHFRLLHELLNGAERITFYLDQDSGIRAACLSAFSQEIQEGRAQAFYVRIKKDATMGVRQAALRASRRQFQERQEANPDLSELDVKLLMIREEMERMQAIGKWNDRWLSHPFPDMGEPEKIVCHLTPTDRVSPRDLEWAYLRASLFPIDRFFMQVRRRNSPMERAITSASSTSRRWYGYSAYNPMTVVKMLEITRVYYNYCKKGDDGQTTAMRLGLADVLVPMEDIIYY